VKLTMTYDPHHYGAGDPAQQQYPYQGAPGQPNPYAHPYAYGYPVGYPYAQPAGALPQSGVGVASFITALIAAVGLGAMIAWAVALAAETGGEIDENSPKAMALGCAFLAGLGLALLAAVLGLVGVLQKGVRKVFAILGLAIGGGMLLLTGLLVLLGMAVG